MIDICCIGDSHLATMKWGWDAVAKQYPGVELTFFAGSGKSMAALASTDQSLVATNDRLRMLLMMISGGLSEIHGQYDAYLVHGLELSIALALQDYREKTEKNALSKWRTTADAGKPLLSLTKLVKQTLAIQTLRKLRKITGAPILLSPTPLSHGRLAPLRGKLHALGDGRRLAGTFQIACDNAAQESEARFVPQPSETLEDGVATKILYSEKPARFYGKNPQKDEMHMSAEYGADILRAVLPLLLKQVA